MVADLAIIVVFIACTSKHSSDIRQHIARKVKTGAPANLGAISGHPFAFWPNRESRKWLRSSPRISNQQVCIQLDAFAVEKSRNTPRVSKPQKSEKMCSLRAGCKRKPRIAAGPSFAFADWPSVPRPPGVAVRSSRLNGQFSTCRPCRRRGRPVQARTWARGSPRPWLRW
jgi:hypothetical protein